MTLHTQHMGYPTILSDSSPQILHQPTTANSFCTQDSETDISLFWPCSFVVHVVVIAKYSMKSKRTHFAKRI